MHLFLAIKNFFSFSELNEIWQYKDLFLILTTRDIKLKYKQTLLGVGWVIFQPLISTVIFTLLFGKVTSFPTVLPYPVFAYIGLLYWTFFSNALVSSSNSLIGSEAILKKVYFPKLVIPLSSLAVASFDFLISMVILVPMLIVYKVDTNIFFWLSIFFGFFISAVTVLGLGLFFATISIRYRDVRFIIPFITQVLIFLTPVFYPLSIVSAKNRWLLSINPMTAIIDLSRSTLTDFQFNHLHLGISVLSALSLLFLGYLYFKKAESYFADIL